MPQVSVRSERVALPDGDLDLTWAEATDTGKRRDINQDAVLASYPLFVVADGMGGHIGGEIASASAVDRLQRMLADGVVSTEAIEGALRRAVTDIASHPEATDDGTGTTVTGLFLETGDDTAEPHWVTLNIGDSRVYLVRDGAINQVTTDHSVVQELMAAGRLSPEEAENHPYGNVITRAVGPSDSVTPDYVRLDVVDGDRFVVCSDGLTKELTDYGILHFLAANADPADAVTAMLDAALENGGRDNITVIVLNVAQTALDADTAPTVAAGAEDATAEIRLPAADPSGVDSSTAPA